MNNFTFQIPTKVIFGKDTQKNIGQYLSGYNPKKVLIVYGGHSAVKSGLIKTVTDSLDSNSISYEILSGVKPNPRLSLVYDGIELGKKTGVDFLLAVGGGSVIDTAKAIALGLADTTTDVWDYYMHRKDAKKCLPVATILTLSAAGSELSESSVITNENGLLKKGYSNDITKPVLSVLNPELTCTLPAYQTSCGCVDIMMHTFERFFSKTNPLSITDEFSYSVIKTIMKYSHIALQHPEDYNARAEIMWTSSMSHCGLTQLGGDGDWATHGIEHELSALFDIAHGAGLSIIWPAWAKYVYKESPDRFVTFAENIFGIKSDDKEKAILEGIEKMEQFFTSIHMPVRASQLDIHLTDEQIELMADKATWGDTVKLGMFKKLDKNALIKIYNLAK